jgi:hypothetical protein
MPGLTARRLLSTGLAAEQGESSLEIAMVSNKIPSHGERDSSIRAPIPRTNDENRFHGSPLNLEKLQLIPSVDSAKNQTADDTEGLGTYMFPFRALPVRPVSSEPTIRSESIPTPVCLSAQPSAFDILCHEHVAEKSVDSLTCSGELPLSGPTNGRLRTSLTTISS